MSAPTFPPGATLRAVTELTAHPANYNRHGEPQIADLATSLKRFGQRKPIVTQGLRILAGHGLVEAARRLGWREVWVAPVPEAWTEAEARAYLAADNELARAGDPDTAQLAALVAELQEADAELARLAAGGEAALRELLAGLKQSTLEDPGAQVDKAEELREKWGVVSGQLWACGTHRIVCGDCTDAATVARVMQGERAALAPVDPPYNVDKDYDGATVDDSKTAQDYEAFSRSWFGLCQSVSERQIVTPGGVNHIQWARWFDSKHCGVWTKTNALTRGRVSNSWCWEPVFFFGEQYQKRRANDVFDYPIGQQKDVANHPCPKPLAMWIDLVENYSEPGDMIYEAFSGSGTTLIACERLGRKCRAVEISALYVSVALERWFQMTGIQPVLLEEA